MPAFLPYQDFLNRTARARALQYAGSQITDATEFERMRAYILQLYGTMRAVHSYRVPDGNIFDCIPIEEQPSLRLVAQANGKVATPPEFSAPPASYAALPLPPQIPQGWKDPEGNEGKCPRGFIPMRRITLDEVTRFGTLEDFFRKVPLRKTHPRFNTYDTAVHRYAHAFQAVNNIGGASWLNLWSPAPSEGNFSLSQHWYSGGTGSGLQTVEGGWQVYPRHYNTATAVLFIYWTADNYQRTGNYNLDAPAFVQTSSNWHLGTGWDSYSTRDGTQFELGLQWKRDPNTGNWWLGLTNSTVTSWEPVGYYPRSLFGSGQLSSFATNIDYGGEVTGTSSGQMGSGEKADAGANRAAYQRAIFYIDTAQESHWSSLDSRESNHSCYTINVHNAGDAGTKFYFGGTSCS